MHPEAHYVALDKDGPNKCWRFKCISINKVESNPSSSLSIWSSRIFL